MNSKERVIRTITFEKPDKLPRDLWTLPATCTKYGAELQQMLEQLDFRSVQVNDPTTDMRIYQKGTFTDVWGSGWLNLQEGIIGEVKHPVLNEDSKLDTYKTPKHLWSMDCFKNTAQDVKEKNDWFTHFGTVSIFERMQFLRGTENLYMDIAEESEFFFTLRDQVVDYYMHVLDMALDYGYDAVHLLDDWGAQRSLLISPDSWVRLFKPAYTEIINKIKSRDKYVFFHSDGYIFDIYEHFIDMGVNAVNSQLWCMGVEKVAEKFAGKITFWGEISRQDTLPNGTAEDIENCVKIMKDNLIVNGGGLIGQFEAGPDTPMDNIRTAFEAWHK